MSNYIEFNNKIAFHPGYYIKEYIDELELTQEDFAYRLGTTPKNLSIIINGEQSISTDIAMKLSKLIETTPEFWLNLQIAYDKLKYELDNQLEIENEIEILKTLNYAYFRDYYNLPNLNKKIVEQVNEVRKFLKVSSLTVLKKENINVRFRKAKLENSESSAIKANAMIQIATNFSQAKKVFPKYDKKKFMESVEFALTLTDKHSEFHSLIKEHFKEAGVDLIILPNIPGSKINGATKVIGNHIMLMIDDRNNNADSFWFTMFHEIGHIINGDYGISFEGDSGEIEDKANSYAENKLINPNDYACFVKKGIFTIQSVYNFAKKINRDPGIVVGRLQKDNYIRYNDNRFNSFRRKYSFK